MYLEWEFLKKYHRKLYLRKPDNLELNSYHHLLDSLEEFDSLEQDHPLICNGEKHILLNMNCN